MTVRSDDIRNAVGTDMSSDPDDPHGWRFDCEVLNPVLRTFVKLKAWWVCRRCSTTVRVSVEVTRAPHSGNEGYDKVVALSRLREMAAAARARTHPRCSEARLVGDVMES